MNKTVETGTQTRQLLVEQLTTIDMLRLSLIARCLDPRRDEDLLQEAITKTLSGERRWRKGISLFAHLYGAMMSIASNWAKKKDEQLILESDYVDRNASDVLGLLEQLPATTPDPLRQVTWKGMVAKIHELFKNSSLERSLLQCFSLGMTPMEIRKQFGLSERDYRAAVRRLRRSIAAEFPEVKKW